MDKINEAKKYNFVINQDGYQTDLCVRPKDNHDLHFLVIIDLFGGLQHSSKCAPPHSFLKTY